MATPGPKLIDPHRLDNSASIAPGPGSPLLAGAPCRLLHTLAAYDRVCVAADRGDDALQRRRRAGAATSRAASRVRGRDGGGRAQSAGTVAVGVALADVLVAHGAGAGWMEVDEVVTKAATTPRWNGRERLLGVAASGAAQKVVEPRTTSIFGRRGGV